MANEFARNIQDAAITPATFTLPSAASSSTTSAAVDLGADTYKAEDFEVELSVPVLTTTINPGAATAGVTYIVESSTTSTFAAIDRTIIRENYAGDTTTPLPAKTLRARVPSNCARYIRGKVSLGATTTDASALAATLKILF